MTDPTPPSLLEQRLAVREQIQTQRRIILGQMADRPYPRSITMHLLLSFYRSGLLTRLALRMAGPRLARPVQLLFVAGQALHFFSTVAPAKDAPRMNAPIAGPVAKK